MSDTRGTMRWEISVPIFKDPVILHQLGIAVGLPFGLVALVIVLTSGRSREVLFSLGVIAALLTLTWLFVMTVYRGKYEVEFILDQKGALCRTQTRQAKKNQIINRLTVILGLLSGKPAVAGAGILAQSKHEVFIRWGNVTKVKYKPLSRVIILRSGWTEQIALFCTRDNYALVERFIFQKTGGTDEESSN